MILSPFLSLQLRPKLSCWIKQSRNIRPNIQVSKEKFQLTIDVKNFDKDEIRVKARPEYVIIEGKQEKKTKKGFVMRQFIRKFKLPHGCRPECMESKLSSDGILTISAPRTIVDSNLPCETLIPVSQSLTEKEVDASFIPVKEKENLCAPYFSSAKDGKDGNKPK